MKRTALPLLLLAVACGGDKTPGAAPTTTAPSSVAPTSATPTPAPTTSFSEPRYFRTPTDNIGCGLDPTFAACDIREKTWTPPPKPSSCEFDWGFGVHLSLRPSPASEVTCASDSAYNAESPVLAYGATLTAGTITCESRTDGVRCTDSASGKGFLLSRDRYELY